MIFQINGPNNPTKNVILWEKKTVYRNLDYMRNGFLILSEGKVVPKS